MRSVIQFTDFIQSLKETESMDTSIDEDELTDRLNLYFEYSDLIQQVEQANSQFESDFDANPDFLNRFSLIFRPGSTHTCGTYPRCFQYYDNL